MWTASPGGIPCQVRRLASQGCLLALMLPLQLMNRLALALDHVLFPGFRRVPVRRPLFIVGPPRSGTTLMHRLVASDTEQFTTFPLWELLFAPAICQKMFWLGLQRIDSCLGGPLRRLLAWLERALGGAQRHIHHTSLLLPEEDYLALFPFGACFLPVIAFPRCAALWRLSRFDGDITPETRRHVLHVYKGLVQRHLYARGTDKIFLSKNPCFTSWIESLSDEFPDARFIGLFRAPEETIPSQLSSIREGVRAFGHDPHDAKLVEEFLRTFEFYYEHLWQCAGRISQERFCLTPYADLKNSPGREVELGLRQLGFEVTEAFSRQLSLLNASARQYRSGHRYSLAEFGLTDCDISRRFGKVYKGLLDESAPEHQPPHTTPAKGEQRTIAGTPASSH